MHGFDILDLDLDQRLGRTVVSCLRVLITSVPPPTSRFITCKDLLFARAKNEIKKSLPPISLYFIK